MTKEKLYDFIISASSGSVIFIAGLGFNEDISYLATLILYTLTQVYAYKKNRLSNEINDKKAKVFTNIMTAILIIGAAGDFVVSNHFVNIFKLDEVVTRSIRFVMALFLLISNILSKYIFPTKELEEIKKLKKT